MDENLTNSIFVISNALVVSGAKSVYSLEQRYEQTLKTIDSIDKACPSSIKIMFDAGETLSEKHVKSIADRGVTVIHTGGQESVKACAQRGLKSVGESLSFHMTLNLIRANNIVADRIYKISGRYWLNDNFVLGSEHVNKFVFTKRTKTWMHEDQIKITGVDHTYQSRLFHFDYSLLPTMLDELKNVMIDCSYLGIDIEHAYFKYMSKYNPIEMDKIGLSGYQAPTGEMVDD
jgi:hypothetical protein